MSKIYQKLSILFLLLFLILPILSGCGGLPTSSGGSKDLPKITLNYWRVWEGPDALDEIISKYNQRHPYINIRYRKFRYQEYEEALLRAFAVDKGPDIFSIPNTWLKKYKDAGFLAPMPPKTTMIFPIVKGTIKKEEILEKRDIPGLAPHQVEQEFVGAVAREVIMPDEKGNLRVYSLPLFVDTLALFYNQELFDNGGIIAPPAYWDQEFQQDVKKLTRQNERGQIIQAGIAMGGTHNIERFSDILAVLMMQNGTTMMENGRVLFHTNPLGEERGSPGVEALRFYTDFANPAKEVYTWNQELPPSLQMFIDGKLAMMFGYSYHIPIIKAKAPKLNFKITSLPQIPGYANKVNFAHYWTEVVARKSPHINEAWNFIQFATAAEQVRDFLKKTRRPTALKKLIPEQSEDPTLGVFAKQLLTARSWYQGNNPQLAEEYMAEMVEAVLAGKSSLEEIIQRAAVKVQQTVNEPFISIK